MFDVRSTRDEVNAKTISTSGYFGPCLLFQSNLICHMTVNIHVHQRCVGNNVTMYLTPQDSAGIPFRAEHHAIADHLDAVFLD